MVATVARSGSWFVTGNVRTYDVWGSVRSGASTGGPKGRYVANLGHVVDDESGLIYMRARFYEPGSGRFLSEDPARAGRNYFVYCSSNATNMTDKSGKTEGPSWLAFLGANLYAWGVMFGLQTMIMCAMAVTPLQVMAACTSALLSIGLFSVSLMFIDAGGGDFKWQMGLAVSIAGLLASGYYGRALLHCAMAEVANAAVGMKSLASVGVSALAMYGFMCTATLVTMQME